MTKPSWVALPELFMSLHSIVLGGDTEWLEEVSETHYHAAVTQRHANHVRF